MNDLRTAAQQVLKALKGYRRELGDQQPCDAEQALKAALAEPQEPVQVESALQAVAEKIGDQCAVWYGIGARDVEEVLREAARHGLVRAALAGPVQEILTQEEINNLTDVHLTADIDTPVGEDEPVAWVEGAEEFARAVESAVLRKMGRPAEPVQEPEPGEYHGWVLREVLFDNGEPVGHREPVQEPMAKCIDDICSEHLGRVEAFDHLPRGTLLYAAPPQNKENT